MIGNAPCFSKVNRARKSTWNQCQAERAISAQIPAELADRGPGRGRRDLLRLFPAAARGGVVGLPIRKGGPGPDRGRACPCPPCRRSTGQGPRRRAQADGAGYRNQSHCEDPLTWVALAAGWAGGLLVSSPHHSIPMPQYMTARATRTAILIGALSANWDRRPAYLQARIAEGIRLAEEGS
jgi:hypothetical protein